jgi:hypothetical protein
MQEKSGVHCETFRVHAEADWIRHPCRGHHDCAPTQQQVVPNHVSSLELALFIPPPSPSPRSDDHDLCNRSCVGIRIRRIRMFLAPPEPLVRCIDPDPDPLLIHVLRRLK